MDSRGQPSRVNNANVHNPITAVQSLIPCIVCTCGCMHRLPDVTCAPTPRYAYMGVVLAHDIIGKMASNYGEVSGASSVFCRPVLGKVQMFC